MSMGETGTLYFCHGSSCNRKCTPVWKRQSSKYWHAAFKL